jgi:hypothetical protein
MTSCCQASTEAANGVLNDADKIVKTTQMLFKTAFEALGTASVVGFCCSKGGSKKIKKNLRGRIGHIRC